MKYVIVEFNSVFDAARGIELMNNYKMVKYQRDHDHGVLKFKIDIFDYHTLVKNHVMFQVIKEEELKE